MHDHEKHVGELNPEVHHEHKDVNAKILLWSAGIFIVFMAVTCVVLWGFFGWMAGKERDAQPQPTTMVRQDAPQLPPEPRLQPFPTPQQGATGADEPVKLTPVVDPLANTPVADMDKMIAEDSEYLASFGWVDRNRGIVRIPVSEAKKLVIARGLPVRQPVAAPAATQPGAAPAVTGTAVPAPVTTTPEITP
jgi:hypothetical protein